MEGIINLLGQPEFFYLLLTIGIYAVSGVLQGKTGWFIFNPLLFTSLVIMLLLLIFNIDYEVYNEAGQYLSILINLATVSLAILLEKNYVFLKENAVAILTGVLAGVFVHAIVVVAMSALILNPRWAATLIPKSITTAIAAPVSASLGEEAQLTIGFAVISCLLGSIIGPPLLRVMNITNPIAQGNALGGSSAAMGTAEAIKMGSLQGSIAGTALVISGIVTVFIAPLVFNLLGAWVF